MTLEHASTLAREILETYSGVYYTAGNDTQRKRAIAEAARHLVLIEERILTETKTETTG